MGVRHAVAMKRRGGRTAAVGALRVRGAREAREVREVRGARGHRWRVDLLQQNLKRGEA